MHENSTPSNAEINHKFIQRISRLVLIYFQIPAELWQQIADAGWQKINGHVCKRKTPSAGLNWQCIKKVAESFALKKDQHQS